MPYAEIPVCATSGREPRKGRIPSAAWTRSAVRRSAQYQAEATAGQHAGGHDDGGPPGERAGDPQLPVGRVGEPHGGEPADDAERDRRERLGDERQNGHHGRGRDQHHGRREPGVQSGRQRTKGEKQPEAGHQSERRRESPLP